MKNPEEKFVNILKINKIDLVATLPCDRIKALLPLLNKNLKTIPLTREENGIGICAGFYLGGGKPVMVIQSTGIGNMINALESLNLTYKIPLPILTSWRGVYKEGIEAQWEFGKRLPQILKASGIEYSVVESEDELDKIDSIIKDAFCNFRPHVGLISPKVWENSSCLPQEPIEITPRVSELNFRREIKKPEMTRYDIIKVITEIINDDIIVSNLGIPSKELYQIKDRKFNFYMTGSMGLVSSIGLGLALSQKKHVYVIDGDGSLIMNPNALIGVGACNPENLTIVAIDNAAYGSTGNQETPTLNQIDLELFAKASGISNTLRVHSYDELKEALFKKISFVHVIAKPINMKCGEIPFTANEIKKRFMVH